MTSRDAAGDAPKPRRRAGAEPSSHLAALLCLDELRVGPPRLEPRRLTVPYAATRDGRAESLELVYKYDEDVFDPEDEGHRNLASMIGAQVALNYGLFCRGIRFDGTYSEADRRFIVEMAENTAREILVKKLLQPNPFLVPDFAPLRPGKLDTYSQARIRFSSPVTGDRQVPWQSWETSHERLAVLSSGGKDSLLSFGLLQELGRETHPIFINESGRHWFTAFNAFKRFKEDVPLTAKVWTNADQMFSWMLRRLPFIRRDFSEVRSDDYPIRLWTVAVFLFGALPLLRRRGIGRLVIGDEYDTTRRRRHLGIRHYDGLFDQSRYFDNYVSRYFLGKGWAVSQFSLLRPLSELLVQKTLVERYPDLQRLQVSCHAAHMREGAARPCGGCEKCRRVVGMLLAADADPSRCGYTPAQVESCLSQMGSKGVHQEEACWRHVLFLLRSKGLLRREGPLIARAEEKPEALSLRFDGERAPLDAVPVDLRRPLYRILLGHAAGAMRRVERRWAPFDLLADRGLAKTYPFEFETKRQPGEGAPRSYLYGELTWPEMTERLRKVDLALLPVGAIEQHGPHLPLDTDAFDAAYLASRVAEACGKPQPLVLPGIPYGVSYHHDEFKGTVSIRNGTLSGLVYDVGMSLARNGIRKLVIINGHGGNSPALNYAAQMINRDARIFVCVDTGETSDVDINELIETPNDVHAGEIETSTALAVRPELVRMRLAKRSVPRFSSRYLDFSSKRSISWHAHTKRISESGVMGDPTRASREKGRRIWEIMVAHLVNLVEELKSLSLEEICQRRY
ncbi:MAG: creatininase family protein [Elusimicrobiota bacterium]